MMNREREKKENLQETCSSLLAKELPVFRKIMNLTQQELGELIGVSRQTIANIESGRQEMRWGTFLALMFLFYFNDETEVYLKSLKIPYKELREWLYGKSKDE